MPKIPIYELRKRTISGPGTYKTIGYFKERSEAVREQSLPMGTSYLNCEWNIRERRGEYDEDRPDRVTIISQKEVGLGRTEFFL